MRDRFRPARDRTMARRPGDEERSIPPGARRIIGWIAAAALIGAIAVAVGVLGGRGEGAPTASAGASPGESTGAAAITFGTSLDPATGAVAAEATTDRFTDGDGFAYSARTADAPPATVYIEVERLRGGPAEVVQTPTPQAVSPGAEVIGVGGIAAASLLEAWGPGEYRLRMLFDPTADAVAEGTFTLERPASSLEPASSARSGS